MSRLLLLAIFAFMFLLGCSVPRGLPTRELKVGGTSLTVEVADSLSSRVQGLSGRDKLGPNHGMLFLFSSPGQYEFWMKDMKFALDFLWLNQGVVTEVVANVPSPSQVKPNPARIRPQE
ncbi:MAG: DUF192 domain-containing protein, partial [Candidatus Kerfeldbacteria bacterium]|nr:DUF192 domain-containing protein [Candidatus Kerfeldbacteria bacterium]